jgi:dCTP deaminase
MSILTGPEIARRHALGEITLSPFDPRRLNPNSYNLALGPTLRVYTDDVLDTRRPNPTEEITLPEGGLVLRPDRVYLGCSVEVIGSDHYAPIVKARSGTARLGLYVHMTADLIDIGSHGQTTFQLHAVQPVRVFAGMVLAQVTFWAPTGEITLYDGKYQNARGPRPSLIHVDAPAPAEAAR